MKILLFILFTLLAIYLLLFWKTTEHFDNNDKNNSVNISIKIIQKPNDKFELDDYKAVDDKDKEILKCNGKWNFDEKNFNISMGNKSIKVVDHDNTYKFENVTLTYKNNDTCGDIVIGNYSDELKACHRDVGYIFFRKSKEKPMATITLLNKGNENVYMLNILDKSVENYKEIFIISFIIFNQTEKELNISLDKVLQKKKLS